MSRLEFNNNHDRQSRAAFVTIGATASFRGLLEEVASDEFLAMLKFLDFTHLIVQCGPDLEYFESIQPQDAKKSYGLSITTFSYAPDLDQYFMQASRGNDENGLRDCGVIISHAGSGSIIGALEFDSKLIVVPNPELMDNHQVEIAEDMATKGFLIHAKLGSIAEAVEKIDTVTLRKWPPGPSPDSAYQQGGLWEAINELMPRSS
ncbi:glycosyltransferase family 28 C-terminal domain-containing protein [Xylaria nigripes]|nr:glycosyltransferase family 28 C-terminal domain-containing protein [Xylaria nigripes]